MRELAQGISSGFAALSCQSEVLLTHVCVWPVCARIGHMYSANQPAVVLAEMAPHVAPTICSSDNCADTYYLAFTAPIPSVLELPAAQMRVCQRFHHPLGSWIPELG